MVKVSIVNLNQIRILIVASFLALGLNASTPVHSSAAGSSATYASCLSQGTNTYIMINKCKNLKPEVALAKPVEYQHCLNMGTNISIQSTKCKKLRPTTKVAKPIEYRFCVKWWGIRDPGCQIYRP
jgi:hypothetical protein